MYEVKEHGYVVEHFLDGKLHKDGDEPAIVFTDGTMKYYKHGKLHRDGDKPAVICPDGYKEYWIEGKFVK